MKILQVICILVAITVIAICQPLIAKRLIVTPPSAAAETEITSALPNMQAPAETTAPPATETVVPAVTPMPAVTEVRRVSSVAVTIPLAAFSPRELAYEDDQQLGVSAAPAGVKVANLEEPDFSMRDAGTSLRDSAAEPAPTQNLTYVAYYVYSELPPEKRPADIVLDTLKSVPQGTVLEEIKRAADAFGLDFNFMKTVAKIESDFDPKNRTGQYIGLFQLSKQEFNKYGSGEITNARDNAIAAAYKFVNEATLFELDTHKNPSPSDLYLIHQQGWQGASEHVLHPERVAWQSMCATDEGKEKGERWCKRAIWGNTLPDIKRAWKSVDKITSAAFVQMWRDRVDSLYARYSAALTQK
jgi:soluble lytic murein transglycosylase-like protein